MIKLINKPRYQTKLKRFAEGGSVRIFQNAGKFNWKVASQNTNRYNPKNDHYLDEIETYGRKYGFNDMQIAAIIANAIHENQGSPLPNGKRVGLFQGDARQAGYIGNTVASNMKAFKLDYDHGTWHNTPDKNGWHPKYYKLFRDGKNVDDVTAGMSMGYERYDTTYNRNHPETQSRIKTARLIYKLFQKGLSASAIYNMQDNDLDQYEFDPSLSID